VPELLQQVKLALASRYAVERALGQGGMASVFLAEDLKHGRQVAVKVIRPELTLTIGMDRFLREIGIASRLSHPHILPVYDSGEASRLMYYVMPYVAGESLRMLLDRVTRLEVDEAVQIASEVAGALAHAHAHHVIHRDIKPANILLSDGHAVVVDFGVARAIGDVGRESITAPGIAVGTPSYMSPEQASGERQLDGRSDIYSLGCVLFEMLVGEPPYTGPSTHAVIAKCFSQPTPSARAERRKVPIHVDRAIARALAKVPAERFSTATEFADALSDPGALPPPPAPTSIAVLPFVNLQGDQEDDYLSDGITEEIISALSKLQGLRVAARTSSFAYKGTSESIPRIGTELGVAAVLDGTVRRSGDRLRVSAQLTNVSEGYPLWAEQFDREMEDVFAIQDEIAGAIVATLKGRLAAERRERIVKRYTENVEAYELYLKGRYVEKTRRPAGFAKGIEYFEQAIAKDPHYALAHAGLADSHTLLAWYRFLAPHEAFPKANIAAMRALDIDELLPEAHTAQAQVRFYYEWDWNGAERAFSRALELNPNDATALHLYAEYLASQRRLNEALAHVQRGHMLEPLSPTINAGLGWMHYFCRDYGQAIEHFRSTLELDPEYVFLHWFLGQCYLLSGEYDTAVDTLRRGLEVSDGHPGMAAYLSYACGRAGDRAEASVLLDSLVQQAVEHYVPSDYLAVAHVGLGQLDDAIRWLERACRERALHLVFLDVDPLFDELRADERFTRILQNLGLKRG
jgi:serine/threonine-protein kinase